MNPLSSANAPLLLAGNHEATSSVDSLFHALYQMHQVILDQTTAHSDQLVEQMLDWVAEHTERLIQHPGVFSDRLPAKLQEAIGLILCSKTKGACITLHDIITTLADLKGKLQSTVLVEAIERAESNGLEHLLDSGFVLIQQKTGRSCALHTAEFYLPTEMTFELFNGLKTKSAMLFREQITNQVNLAKTNKNFLGDFYGFYSTALNNNCEETANLYQQGKTPPEIYRHHPECRKQAFAADFSNGLDYLNQRGVGGPYTAAAIRSGRLTVDAALTRKERVLQEIKALFESLGRLDQFIALNNELHIGVKKYLIDFYDFLRVEKGVPIFLSQLKPTSAAILCEPCVQKYIDRGTLGYYRACNLTPQAVQLLKNPFVQKNLDRGKFKMDVILDLAESAPDNLSDDAVQKLISSDKLTLMQGASLAREVVAVLQIPTVLHDIHTGVLDVFDFSQLVDNRICLKLEYLSLKYLPIRDRIREGKVCIEQTAGLESGQILVLCHPSIDRCIVNKKFTLAEVIDFLKIPTIKKCLPSLVIEDLIKLLQSPRLASRLVELLSLTSVYEGGVVADYMYLLQINMDRNYSKSELNYLMWLLHHPGVKKYTDCGWLAKDEVITCKKGANFNVLGSPGVQKYIDNGMLNIGVAIYNLSDDGIIALNNAKLQALIDKTGRIDKVALKSWFRDDEKLVVLKRPRPQIDPNGLISDVHPKSKLRRFK